MRNIVFEHMRANQHTNNKQHDNMHHDNNISRGRNGSICMDRHIPQTEEDNIDQKECDDARRKGELSLIYNENTEFGDV